MSRLKDRNKFIPNGFVFYQPETGWQPQRMQSFETIVGAIIAHRNANAWLRDKNGWPTDHDAVADELDRFNTKICQQMGWTSYISEGTDTSPPPPMPLPQRLLRKGANVAAGAEILVDWILDGAEAVPSQQSTARALVCTTCEKNGKGDLLSIFTRPAAEAIRRTVQRKNAMNLTTIHDDALGVCTVCDCPLQLKVHLKIEAIAAKLSPAVQSELPEWCWIRKELA
jgi:hypothetical protein